MNYCVISANNTFIDFDDGQSCGILVIRWIRNKNKDFHLQEEKKIKLN